MQSSKLFRSLVDWDMSSDRNPVVGDVDGRDSLVDWDMSSDRNAKRLVTLNTFSLVDWDMSSDRNISCFPVLP